ncbi:MAG: ribosomal-processing cysteine protease Prp [Candidatus Weimeria sp.]|nr:ribosomal-processing cysteine protease Prp [Lachnospiraceae bacterium]MEE3355503.1 ribosomal-processing cysteine protease Prp [Candidatus Weimeria sp.]
MIRVTVTKHHGTYTGIVCDGHAGFSEYGTDIVCAACSMLVINTINSLDAITHTAMDVVSEESGHLEVVFQKRLDDRELVLLDAMILGLTQVRKEYGKSYLKFYIKEV